MKNECAVQMKSAMGPLLLDASNEYDFDFPSELLPLDKQNIPTLYDHSKKIVELIVQYKEMMMMYTCAIKEIRTRFEVLNAEFNVRHSRNPINSITTRMKRSSSLIEKMKKNHISLSLDNIEDNIDDVAGIRVICPYVDDIYQISQALINQHDIELLSQKDYIANPKPNGYRSLHMIIRIPVHFENHLRQVKVEVQIRTIAMDFWATLEHELKYKNQNFNENEIISELKKCADIISDADHKMLEIRKRIENNPPERSEDELLIEQIRKLDHPLM